MTSPKDTDSAKTVRIIKSKPPVKISAATGAVPTQKLMKKAEILAKLKKDPVIIAIKDQAALEASLGCQNPIAFLLFGNLITLPQLVDRLKEQGKIVFVHFDLIDGLQPHEVSVKYLHQETKLDGLISTRENVVSWAARQNVLTLQRFFLLDSRSVHNIARSESLPNADFVELIPGLLPQYLRRFSEIYTNPLIAGGLISEKKDIVAALEAGAVAVSTTQQSLWSY